MCSHDNISELYMTQDYLRTSGVDRVFVLYLVQPLVNMKDRSEIVYFYCVKISLAVPQRD